MKIKISSIEVLGYLGIFSWGIILIIRSSGLFLSNQFRFLVDIIPNIGAAWAFTMFAKWLIVYGFKLQFSLKSHLFTCLSILAIAIGSEVLHDVFFNSPFDTRDICATLAAQLLIFISPLLCKDFNK